MIKRIFRCNTCEKAFNSPEFYEEAHGLDAPPYERVAVCPVCNSSDFILFERDIEKIAVAERLLPVVAAFNRYFEDIKDVFGVASVNNDFSEGYEMLTEFINEIFSFITVEKQREILKMNTQNDTQKVFLYLKG